MKKNVHKEMITCTVNTGVGEPNLRNKFLKTRNFSGTYMSPLVQNTKLLLICTRHGRNPRTKFGIDQVKGSKDIVRTTQWAEKRSLTLTFEHAT